MPSTDDSARRAYSPLSFTAVRIEDDFWAPRQETNRQRTLAIEYDQLRDTGRIHSLKLQWKPGDQPTPHIFWDSDIAKWIEAASYSLATQPDPDLDALLDEVIDLDRLRPAARRLLSTPTSQWLSLKSAGPICATSTSCTAPVI